MDSGLLDGWLPKPSVILVGKLFTMHRGLLVGELGRVTSAKQREVLERLRRLSSAQDCRNRTPGQPFSTVRMEQIRRLMRIFPEPLSRRPRRRLRYARRLTWCRASRDLVNQRQHVVCGLSLIG